MFFRLTKTYVGFVTLACALASPCFAGSEEILVISPAPNKSACVSASSKIGDDSFKSELCVRQGSFSPDKYVLKLNGDTVLQGIDDQTTSGIQASYKGKPIALRCPPQNVSANVTAAEIHKLVPSYPAEKVKEVVELMAGSSMPMEIGRLCQVSIGNEPAMKVQVLF